MQRLKTRPQFQATLAGGTVSRTPHFALHRLKLPESQPQATPESSGAHIPLFHSQDVWLGAMVPKRWAKRAVTRNGMRRQIYAVFNDANNGSIAAASNGHAMVVRLRRSFNREAYVSAWSIPLAKAVREQLVRLAIPFANADGVSRDV